MNLTGLALPRGTNQFLYGFLCHKVIDLVFFALHQCRTFCRTF